MIILLSIIFFAMYGVSSDAQTLPALYDVTGVEADDSLNVRTAPDATSNIVATIHSTGTNIEVIAINDTQGWGLVNIGEQSGWTSLRYLERQPNQDTGDFPAITDCYGTEPFWNIDFDESIASWIDKPIADFIHSVSS